MIRYIKGSYINYPVHFYIKNFLLYNKYSLYTQFRYRIKQLFPSNVANSRRKKYTALITFIDIIVVVDINFI